MLKNLFTKAKKSKKQVELFSPLSGRAVALEEVSDPVFSEKLMGDGIAILPTTGEVTAPCDGIINNVFPTKHAIGIISSTNVPMLIHIGLETVTMDGEGFQVYVTSGQSVKKGDLLLTFDLEKIKDKAAHTITPFIILNEENSFSIESNVAADTVVAAGKTSLLSVYTNT